jgi:acylglycerol lipase
MIKVLVLAAATLVAACAPRTYSGGPMVTEPVLFEHHWQAADGALLPLRSWRPTGEPQAVVLALHGMNDYSKAFDTPGTALAAKGIATYAYDQRGFGAGPHPGYWSSPEIMADDLRAAIRLLRVRHPSIPLYVLGESMGGAVAILALAGPPNAAVDGLILSAPALWGRSSMGVLQKAVLWLSHRIAPGWRLTGRNLGIRPSDNIEMLRALSRDPLVIKETRVDAIHGIVSLMDAAQAAVGRLRGPLLLLYGANDEVIPAPPTWAAIRHLPDLGRDQRIALYDRGWHMLLRDLQAQVVIDDIAVWIGTATAPLPSGADDRAARMLAETR